MTLIPLIPPYTLGFSQHVNTNSINSVVGDHRRHLANRIAAKRKINENEYENEKCGK